MIEDLVVLAGGLGKRLRSVSGALPKPLVPVAEGLTVLDCVLGATSNWNIQRVILSLGYRPEAFSDWLIQGKWPFLLESLVEKEPLGTGGALAFAVHENDLKAPFAVLNGDTYVEVDFQEMSACFQDSKLPAMLGLSFVENCERYGAVEFNEDLAVNFNEKDDSAGAGWINNGCYLLNPSLFESRTGKFSLERDLFPSLCKKGMLGVFCCEGAFRDVGIPEDFERFRNIDLPAILARQQTVRTKPS